MGSIVDATVPTDQFALGEAFDRTDDADVETVPVVAPQDGNVMPFLWGRAADLDALHRGFRKDPSTASVECLSRNDDCSLYKVRWEPRIRTIVSVFLQSEGTLLGAKAKEDHWTFRILFPEHDTISKTHGYCQENGIDLSIRRVQRVDYSTDRDRERSELSDKQHEALTAASEQGYYEIPRSITLEELAEQVGVSHQALSERLRRGHHKLISNSVRDTVVPVEIHV